jgi:hypothetical protein
MNLSFYHIFVGVFHSSTCKENECCHVVGNLLRKLIPEMYYEARVRCVINWYAQVKRIPLPKSNARLRLMTREQYNLVSILASYLLHDRKLVSIPYILYHVYIGASSMVRLQESVLCPDSGWLGKPGVPGKSP